MKNMYLYLKTKVNREADRHPMLFPEQDSKVSMDCKKKIIPTFFSGFVHKTETTFGNNKDDVCAFMIPNFHRKSFCDCILHSPYTDIRNNKVTSQDSK